MGAPRWLSRSPPSRGISTITGLRYGGVWPASSEGCSHRPRVLRAVGQRGPTWHPRVVRRREVKSVLSLIEGGMYRGHEGVRRWFADVYSDWTEFCPEVRAFHAGEEALLVAG